MSEAQKRAREMAEVMLAFAEGKAVESESNGNWFGTSRPPWNWQFSNYRVKPEPRRLWAVYSEQQCNGVYFDVQLASKVATDNDWTVREFVEVTTKGDGNG